jgi:hypothetical protein
MSSRTQITSEEDRVAGRTRISTPKHMAAYVSTYVNAPCREWLAAVLLDPQQYLIGEPYLISAGTRCPIDASDLTAFFAHAKAAQAHTIMTIRYHPHPPLELDAAAYERFHQLRLQAKANGTPLRNHLTNHVTGKVWSWRDGIQSVGDGDASPGTSCSISSTIRRLCSAAMAPLTIASMTIL